MNQFAEINNHSRLAGLLERAGIRGRQLAETFQFTKDSIINVLKEELKKGNVQEVLAILKGKPMAAGTRILKNEITGQVVKGLIFRFGIRKIVAVGIAALIIPFVIGKLTHQIIKGKHVPDFIQSLNIKTKMQEIFASRNVVQPSPEQISLAEADTYEKEFLTD